MKSDKLRPILSWLVAFLFFPLITNTISLSAQELICPANYPVISCNTDFSITVTGQPLLENFCENPIITYTDNILPGNCPNNFSIERVFNVTDDCGNNVTCTQIITVVDASPPVFAEPIFPLNPNIFSLAGRTSRLSNINLAGSGANIAEVLPGATVTLTFDRITTYDPDGLCPTCITQHYVGIPGVFSMCLFSTTGNSSGSHSVDFTAPAQPGIYYITRTATFWYFCDQYGIPDLPTSPDAAIAVLIVGAPGCPPDITVPWAGAPPDPAITGMPVYADACGPEITVTYTDEVHFSFDCPAVGTIIRTFVITDACGNVNTCTQTITLLDDAPPVIICPTDITVNCGDITAPSVTGFPQVIDLVDPAPFVTYTDEVVSHPCPLGDVIRRTWTVVDLCGNTSTCTQIIVVSALEYQIAQIDMEAPYQIPNSTYGSFELTYPPVGELSFINVMGRNPQTGQTAWIVENLPLFPFPEPQTMDYWFDWRLLGYEQGQDIAQIDMAMWQSPGIMTGPMAPEIWLPVSVSNKPYVVISDNPAEVSITAPVAVDSFAYNIFHPIEHKFRGCTVPNIDLDGENHPVSGTYAGDLNGCGPAAAANSMQWLEDTDPRINTSTTHRDKMESMSADMERCNGCGVNTQQLIKGKLAFIDRHQLPIRVKFQSLYINEETIASPNPLYGHQAANESAHPGQQSHPSWDFLKQEMEKGEDVEILYGWYNSSGVRHGGHWITVTGYLDAGDFELISFKDDAIQEISTGTSHLPMRIQRQGERWRLVGFDGPNNYCWVESIVSESYDSTVTFNLIDIELIRPIWPPNSGINEDQRAILSFRYPPAATSQYLNVVAALPESTTSEWAIRNVWLPPRDVTTSLSVWWDMSHIGVQPGQAVDLVNLQISVADAVSIDGDFVPDYIFDWPIDTVIYNVGNGALDNTGLTTPYVYHELPNYTTALLEDSTFRGCVVPNIDLVSIEHPATVSYAGDWNACAPAAAANSLQWLERTHPLIDSTSGHREKLEELSGFMKRAPNSGAYTDSMIVGKLAYIDKYKLPIKVKFQSVKFGTGHFQSPNPLFNHRAENMNSAPHAKPSWDWLVEEMRKGEDVELEFGHYDSTGVRWGGHWITVTGTANVGGAKGIYFKDDFEQLVPGGLRNDQYVGWSENDNKVWLCFSSSKYIRRVETLVSESYDSTVVFTAVNEPDKNPFNMSVYRNPSAVEEEIWLRFELPDAEEVVIAMYNAAGQKVSILRPGRLAGGQQQLRLDQSHFGPAGIYTVVVRAGDRQSAIHVIKQ